MAGATTEAIQTAKALKCTVCARGLGRPVKLARVSTIRIATAFNEHIYLDVFYVSDKAQTLYPMLGILDDNSTFHVVVRLYEHDSEHVFNMLHLVWMSWAGPPLKITLDKDPKFLGVFRRSMEYLETELNYVPAEAHWKLRVERHDAAWRRIFNRIVDEKGIVGPGEVDIASIATNDAKNQLTKRCGHSPCQAVFGREPRLPDALTAEGGGLTNASQMSEDAVLQRRNEIRVAAQIGLAKENLDMSVRRGLRMQTRPSRGDYKPGGRVAYWRPAPAVAHWCVR